jgi:hypothetical protein
VPVAEPTPLSAAVREKIADFARRTRVFRKNPPYYGKTVEGPTPPIRPFWMPSGNIDPTLVAQYYRVDPAAGTISLAAGAGTNLLLHYPPKAQDPEKDDREIWGPGLQLACVPPPSLPADGTMLSHVFTFPSSPSVRLARVSVFVRVPNPLREDNPEADGVYVGGSGLQAGVQAVWARLALYVGADWRIGGPSWKGGGCEFFAYPPADPGAPTFTEPGPLEYEAELVPGTNFVSVAVRAEAAAANVAFEAYSANCACLNLLDPTSKLRMTPQGTFMWDDHELVRANPIENCGPIKVTEFKLSLTEMP